MTKSFDVRKENIAICRMLNSDEVVSIYELISEFSSYMGPFVSGGEHSQDSLDYRKVFETVATKFREVGGDIKQIKGKKLDEWKDAILYFKESRLKPLQRVVRAAVQEVIKAGCPVCNGVVIDESKTISYGDDWVKGFEGLLDLYLLRARNSRIEKRATEVIQGCLSYSLVSQIQEWIKERECELMDDDGDLNELPEYVISLEDSLYERGSKELISEQRMLSRLAYCIIFRKTVTISYKPHFLEGKADILTFHPEHLRRVGHKWMVYGLSTSSHYKTTKYVNLVINRIEQIHESPEAYVASGVDYSEFKNQITFHSFTVNKQSLETVRLKVLKKREKQGFSEAVYPFARIQQEPLHASQRVVESKETDDFGVVEFRIKDADFIYPMLLAWGADIEVLAPDSLRQKMQTEAFAMRDMYMDQSSHLMK